MNDHAKQPFFTTHWSVVLTAKGDGPEADGALRKLCDLYYRPVLHFVERSVEGDARRIYGGRDAKDLTHDFFARLLERKMFESLQRDGGRFRSYLLGAVKHFLAHVRETESRIKRGGDVRLVPLPDDQTCFEPPDDAIFDRDWAQSMLQNAYDDLGNSVEVQTFLPWITRELDGENRRMIAEKLEMTDVAVKVALHRLRKRFRETMHEKIAETVESPSEIDGELDHLIRALRGTISGQEA